jgi:hypothetical protein
MPLEFSTRTARFRFDDEAEILYGEGFEGAEQTLADAEEEIQRLVATGRRYRIIIDLTRIRSMNRESRAVYGGRRGAQAYSAIAILASSQLGRAIGNFFLGLNKPPVPTRLFSSLGEARAWLQQQPPGR